MRREFRQARPDYKAKVERLGLLFHSNDDCPYWFESAAYAFSEDEITTLESASNELHLRCLDAAELLIEGRKLGRLGIPEWAHQPIEASWEKDPPAIYGRFDLSIEPNGVPKLLEYNADTPTSLLEAAVIQWHWLQECEPAADQFNSIWEGLVEKWTDLKGEGFFASNVIHFACAEAWEDLMTTAAMMDTAREAGFDPKLIGIDQLGWDVQIKRFVDLDERCIDACFKLYPWEWMLQDEFGKFAAEAPGAPFWIEPIWKMALSNKGLLAILWEMFPDHPNLVPAYFDGPRELSNYVSKPLLGREGANVAIHRNGETIVNEGPYAGPNVYQAYVPLPEFDGNHAVIGSWIIDGVARGIGIRESDGPITEDLARFVPHYFVPEKSTDTGVKLES